MGFFTRWRLRSRIRRAVALRKRLRRKYGARSTYTAEQVKTAARRNHRDHDMMLWAYAIHCGPASFASAGLGGDYHELRSQVDQLFSSRSLGLAKSEGLTDTQAVEFSGTADGVADFGGGDGGDGGGGGD
ncbi:MAG: hypothetical protein MRY74_10555 [Neomegalonema sp.]|nr:hypothetical protein [Neomegalonema sp.]